MYGGNKKIQFAVEMNNYIFGYRIIDYGNTSVWYQIDVTSPST